MLNSIGMRPLAQLYLTHYTAIIAVLISSLIGLTILISNNKHYRHQEKLYGNINLTLLIFYNLTDWLSVILTFVNNSSYLHLTAKAFSYILPPIFCCFLVELLRQAKPPKLLLATAVANTVFQIASIFTGWCFYLNKQNILIHGPYHYFYTFCWIICLIYVAWALALYSKKFSLSNKLFIAYMFCFIAAGVLTQDLTGGYIRTASLTFSIAFIILVLDYQVIDLEISDKTIGQKNELIERDVLTGLESRYAYESILARYQQPLRDLQVTAFSIDLNGLKGVNDTYGHSAGDLYIQSAAKIIQNTFIGNNCYRTGGDEFAVIMFDSKERGEQLLDKLTWNLAETNKKQQLAISFAVGMAFSEENQNGNLKELMIMADQRMYEDKAIYYQDPHHDRRRN